MVRHTFKISFFLLVIFVIFTIFLFYIFGFIEEHVVPKKLPPTPFSLMPLYPSGMSLLNLNRFSYMINNDICSNEKIYIVIIIHSHPANKQRRDAMRRSIPFQDLLDLGIRRGFLLARAEWDDQILYQKTPQKDIIEENSSYGDIVQGDFKEHYHNLTYKHIMGLQWSKRYCSQAKYILKMDDDIIVDLYRFREKLLYRYKLRQNLILGLLQIEARPVRDNKSKWYMPESEFSSLNYPNFVSGWVYAMSMDAAKGIVLQSKNSKFFWIDDVFVTGILAEAAGVKREGLNQLYTLHSVHMKCCIDLPHYKEYHCDFYAGPSEGDIDLMKSVLKHFRYCYINSCSKRTLVDNIARTCVTTLNPFDPIGVGHGEVIKVF